MSTRRAKRLIGMCIVTLVILWGSIGIRHARGAELNPWDSLPDRHTVSCWWATNDYLGCQISKDAFGYFSRADEFDPSGEGYIAWYASPSRWLVCDPFATDADTMCWIVKYNKEIQDVP